MQVADVETWEEESYLDGAVRKASLRCYLSQDLRNAGSAVRKKWRYLWVGVSGPRKRQTGTRKGKGTHGTEAGRGRGAKLCLEK